MASAAPTGSPPDSPSGTHPGGESRSSSFDGEAVEALVRELVLRVARLEPAYGLGLGLSEREKPALVEQVDAARLLQIGPQIIGAVQKRDVIRMLEIRLSDDAGEETVRSPFVCRVVWLP